MIRSTRIALSFAAIILFAFGLQTALAQVVGGTLSGTITDATGAAVANAAVLVHNDETGSERHLQTSPDGRYNAPAIQVGRYTITVDAEGFTQQLEDQTTETENLRGAFQRLQQKLTETRTATELLISRNRRARAIQKAQSTSVANPAATLGRLRTTIQQVESGNAAQQALLADPGLNASLDDRFESMERDDKVEALLADLKSRQQNRLLQLKHADRLL